MALDAAALHGMSLAETLELLKTAARANPAALVVGMREHLERSPHFSMAILLQLGHELPCAVLERLVLEIAKREDVPAFTGPGGSS
jgi:hypothetical protein